MAANGRHLPAWNRIKRSKVVAICDVDKNMAIGTAKRWNIPYVYEDLDEALMHHEQAIVDVITPPSTHASLSVRAMELGHHVVLEKPMAMNEEETTRIYQEYLKRKDEIRFCVIQNFLVTPSIQKVRSILAQRKIEILSVDVRMLHTSADEMISNRDHWVHTLPGGRFGENLIHPVYLLRNLMGRQLNLRDVYAAKRGTYEWVQNDELCATFDSYGKYGSIYISFNSSRRTLPFSLLIYGANAIVCLDGTNATCVVQGPLTDAYLPDARLSRTRLLKDGLSSSAAILSSTMSNMIEVLGNRRTTGHETIFRSLVASILEGAEMPYTAQEAYEANLTFLQVLSRLNRPPP
jgi:predicted dehydrogenase